VKRLLALAVLSVLCGMATRSNAQTPASNGKYTPYSLPGISGSFNQYGPDYHHASTFPEGLLRGQAAVIRSYAQYNFLNQVGSVYQAEAERKFMKNQQQAEEIRQAKREQYIKARAEEIARRREKLTAYLNASRTARPVSRLVNETSGEVLFPAVLQGAELEEYRQKVSKFFATRASTDAMSFQERQQLAVVTDQLLEDLKGQVREIPAQDYAAARRFLQEIGRQLRTLPS
jgi:hypothetical protein